MFSITHTDGSGDDDPSPETLALLYDELQWSSPEHGDVAVVDEDTGWAMSAHRDGRLVIEHLVDGAPRHMIPVTKDRVIELWMRFIGGDLDGVLKEPWRP